MQCRANALQHGLAAEVVLLPGEDPAALEHLSEALRSYYSPASAWEDQLVEQAVSIMIRLKRVPAFEAALFKWMRRRQIEIERASIPPFDITMPSLYDTDDTEAANLDVDGAEQQTGRTFAALLDHNLLSKLHRCEVCLQRRPRSTLRQLDDLRAHRLWGERDA